MAMLQLDDDPYRAPTIQGAGGGTTPQQGRQRSQSPSPYASTQQPTGYRAPTTTYQPSNAQTGNRQNPYTAPGSQAPQTDWAAFFQSLLNPTNPSGMQTQGGSYSDPRWTNGTWGGTSGGGYVPPWDPSQPMPQLTGGQEWFRSIASGYGNTVTPDSLRAMLPVLNAQGYRVQNQERGDLRPRLFGPDGLTYDLGQWGQPWDWIARGNTGGEYGGTGGGMGGMFDNPLLQQFINFGQQGMDQLMQPQSIHPVLQQALDALTGLMGYSDPGYAQFQGIANKRLAELDKPAYTDAQRDLITTNFSEPVEAQRTARKQQALERAGARGMAPSSGLLEMDTRDIDKSFDSILGTGRRQLAVDEIAANEARQQEAVSIGQLLASLSGKDLPVKLSAAGQMGNIGGNLQNEGTNRLIQALGISQQMAQLPGQQLQHALAALGGLNNTPVPQADPTTALITSLLALATGGTNAGNQAAGQDQAFWASLFQALPGLFGAIPGATPPANQARPRSA